MSKISDSSRRRRWDPGSEKTSPAEQAHGVLRRIKAAWHNAPTNCMSNEAGRTAGPWRTG